MILNDEAEALALEWVINEQQMWRAKERVLIEQEVRAELVAKEKAAREQHVQALRP